MKTTAAAVLAALLAGCATTATSEPGWHGEGAEPFGPSEAACNAEIAKGTQGSEGGKALFDACMARHGWHRVPR